MRKRNTDTDEKTPNPLRNDGRKEPVISTKSAQIQSSEKEKNKTTDIEEKTFNRLRKDGCKETGISTKSAQNQSSKNEKKNLT